MRIIQDSEDEDDFELEPIAAGVQLPDASPDHSSTNDLAKPGEKGSGSTESLRRAIVGAHHAQFRDDGSSAEHQARRNSSELSVINYANTRDVARAATDSSIAFSGRASKRRRTSLDGVLALSSARDILPVSRADSHNGQADNTNTAHLGCTQERVCDLRDNMQDHWEHREFTALLTHPASSTIPNATATQQQLLAEVLAPAFLGIGQDSASQLCEAPKYEPAKSSVPWSEYLKSSSEAQILHESAEQQTFSLSNNSSAPADISNRKYTSQDSETALPRELVAPPSRPVVEPLSEDEEPANEATFQSSPDPIVSPRNSMKQMFNTESNVDADFLAAGVQEEQYKPRPSRSRSSILVGQEPIDYSKRPEMSVRKARRTRTSGDVESVSSATTPEKVRQICDMGFTPTATRKALRQHNGDVTHTVNWLVAASGTNGDEQLSSEPPKSNARRKSKRDLNERVPPAEMNQDMPAELVVEGSSTSYEAAHSVAPHHAPHHAPEHTVTSTVMKSPTVVKVVIPRTAKPVVTQPNIEDLDAEPLSVDQVTEEVAEEIIEGKDIIDIPPEGDVHSTLVEVPRGKKRGRGRPKKETKLSGLVENKPSEQTYEPVLPVQGDSNDVKENGPKTPAALDDGVSGDQTEELDGMESRPTTPKISPEKKVKQANETPSAISKPKTPYRVGLSKRARIAPLLRIVKK